MPEFISRVDNYSWQTPAFSEVFSLEDVLFHDESELEQTRIKAENYFSQFGIPLNLTNERIMPSYSSYEAELDTPVVIDNIQNSIYEIETLNQGRWVIGFNPISHQKIRLFLRTSSHQSLNWKHLVTRITFRKTDAESSFVVGVNLDQKTIILDWDTIGHFMISGTGGSKQSIVRNIIITAMMLHTPSEFRFALIGKDSDTYRQLREAPHALGSKPHNQPKLGSNLIKGMGRELKRRRQIFKAYNVDDFNQCNLILEDEGETVLPRLLLVLDSLQNKEWIKFHEEWLPALDKLIENGAKYGIHLLITTRSLHLPYPFDEISNKLTYKIVTRTAIVDTPFLDQLKDFHQSTLPFIDSFLTHDGDVSPIELPAITTSDVRSLVTYWQDNMQSRHESINLLNISGDGEDTVRKLVKELVQEKSNVAPPIPQKPSAETLARATEILAEDEEAGEIYNMDERVSSNGHLVLTESSNLNITVDTVHRAQALATYLGWLGKGPLMDVLGLTVEEANAVIAILQVRQILERGSNPTPHLHFKRRR